MSKASSAARGRRAERLPIGREIKWAPSAATSTARRRSTIAGRSRASSPAEAQALVDRWYPRALDMFGHSGSAASRQAIEWGIKKWDNDEVRTMYVDEVGQVIRELDLTVPPPDRGRRIA